MRTEYDDNYPTCVETYATLRIFGESVELDDVSRMLASSPTRTQRKCQPLREGAKTSAKLSGWFLETRAVVQSKDSRRHLDLLLDLLKSKVPEIQEMQARGMKIDICCYWLSIGQGGPAIGPEQSKVLGALGIELWFDVYFDDAADA